MKTITVKLTDRKDIRPVIRYAYNGAYLTGIQVVTKKDYNFFKENGYLIDSALVRMKLYIDPVFVGTLDQFDSYLKDRVSEILVEKKIAIHTKVYGDDYISII